MNERVNLSRLLCTGQPDALLPLKCLKVDANFCLEDFFSVLDRAVNLELLFITSWDPGVFESISLALARDSTRCPELRGLRFVADGVECDIEKLTTMNTDKPNASFQSLPVDVLLEIFKVSELPLRLTYALDDFHTSGWESPEGDPVDDNVKLSRHSPHLRLRTLCRSLRDAVDEYQPFWQYLRIDWTEPSALEISKLWFRNRRIGDIRLSVVPYKYYTKKHAQLVPPSPNPELVECLQQHAGHITSATFHLPDGVDYFLTLAQALQPHVERMQYVKLHCNMPETCATMYTICNGGQWVMLNRLHVHDCHHQWNPVDLMRKKMPPSPTPMLRRLPKNAKMSMGACGPFLRQLALLIRREVLLELVLFPGWDSMATVHDFLRNEGASLNLRSLYIEMKMRGLAHPDSDATIDRNDEIRIPTLTTLTLALNFEGYHEADTPKDGQRLVLDFIATFRCPDLTYLAIFSDAIGDCEGPMNERVNLSRLLCTGQPDALLPLKCLKLDADFCLEDFFSVLDRAVNLELLFITSWHLGVFESISLALARDSTRCPELRVLYFVADGVECDIEKLTTIAPLYRDVARSRLGDTYSGRFYTNFPRAQSKGWPRFELDSHYSFAIADGEPETLHVFHAVRNL
ncbi:hypothetical protein PAXINDRAFT_21341 [Paxillus involutus ATCC 200175]|uniref:Uncharacterized protein n=1 Tax=Paxillus involutus ATCC 200175 TaxID=664439 RepID=A0A0C9TDQ4_PAXIN|nr:hypothetical protein PAXINDRAFT_21341 [Paxillus involutus ATCC 200175]